MEREDIENAIKSQIMVLNNVKTTIDKYIGEFQEIEKELEEDSYKSESGSYEYAVKYDKDLVKELSKKMKENLKKLKHLEKQAESVEPLVDMFPRPWGAPKEPNK